MKKLLTLALAALLCFSLAACNPTSKEKEIDTSFSEEPVTLKVMLMPQSDMNSDTVAKVTEAVNNRIAELGFIFKVEFSWSGGAWGWEQLNTALQTAAAPDIFPAHTWSGNITYTVGAQEGQYLRLDGEKTNLLELLAPDLYKNSSPAIKAAATIPGDQGRGIYAYIIEKDSVSQLGYLVNKTVLEELGFSLSDFKADDFASWEPLLAAYKAAYPDKYPLNAEAEVLDRTVNHIAYVDNTIGALGVQFDNANPSGTNVEIISRYQSSTYKDFLTTVNGYYKSGYIDPDLGQAGEVSSAAMQANRDSGNFLISNFVYAPGGENPVSLSATAAQGRDIEIAWVPGWSVPLATTETALGSGLAVSAGTQHVAEAVTFLNLLAKDTTLGNLLAEGVEGVSHRIENGIAWRDPADRAGWSIWRYGVVGGRSAATPLGDVEPNGKEWDNLNSFNGAAAALESTGWLFDSTPVDSAYAACNATIDKYAVPLGSGASDPAQYDAFINELEANGLKEVVEEAQKQYKEWKNNK